MRGAVALACAVLWGCGGAPSAPTPDAAPAAEPEVVDGVEGAEIDPADVAFDALQALSTEVQALLADARDTMRHPDAPAADVLAALESRHGACVRRLADVVPVNDPAVFVLRTELDNSCAEAESILRAWQSGRRPVPRDTDMGMGH